MSVEVNKSWCKKCRVCIEVCPNEAMGQDEQGYAAVVNPDKCISCATCEWICPDYALSVTERKRKAV